MSSSVFEDYLEGCENFGTSWNRVDGIALSLGLYDDDMKLKKFSIEGIDDIVEKLDKEFVRELNNWKNSVIGTFSPCSSGVGVTMNGFQDHCRKYHPANYQNILSDAQTALANKSRALHGHAFGAILSLTMRGFGLPFVKEVKNKKGYKVDFLVKDHFTLHLKTSSRERYKHVLNDHDGSPAYYLTLEEEEKAFRDLNKIGITIVCPRSISKKYNSGVLSFCGLFNELGAANPSVEMKVEVNDELPKAFFRAAK